MRRLLLDYVSIVAAGCLYAVALKYFVLPSEVILTGTEGFATALSYYYESYALFIVLYVVFQAIVLAFGLWKVSRVFAVRSAVVVATVVSLLLTLPELRFASPESQNERIMLVLFGGILAGLAKALAFSRRGSTGDEDIVAAYVASKYLKPVGSVAMVAGGVSTAFGLALAYAKHGDFEAVVNTLMYTAVYIFVSAETLNNLYRKFKVTMLVVITRRQAEVGRAIVAAVAHRTFTVQAGRGGRSGAEVGLVRTVLTHEELPAMLEAVQAADPECFYYHHGLEGISRRYYIAPIG